MKAIIILILVIFLSYVIGQKLSKEDAVVKQETVFNSSCDPTKQICTFKNKNSLYSVEFTEPPSALSPFTVKIKLESLQPQSVELTFEMEGMDMGFNTYGLVKNKKIWSAEVILPVCSLARNDWFLNVRMEFENRVSVSRFKFSQAKK